MQPITPQERKCLMAIVVSYRVFAILVPDRTAQALAVINTLSDRSNYQAVLGTNTTEVTTGLQGQFPWLTVVNAVSLAATWQAESLPQDMGVQLNFALLMGAAVL